MKYFEQNEYLILSMKYLILFVKYLMLSVKYLMLSVKCFMLLVKQLMLSVKYLNKGRKKIPNNFQTFRTVRHTLTVKNLKTLRSVGLRPPSLINAIYQIFENICK